MPQGTIKDYDPTNRSGLILDDARNELAYDLESFRESGIRMFRIGQRVKFQLVGEGSNAKVRNLNIVTFS